MNNSDKVTERSGPKKVLIKNGTPILPLIILFAVIVSLWITSGLVLWQVIPDWATRGAVGDTFGAVNSLFSGLAFAGVIYTILLQRKELMYQREELELNRREVSRSADAQEKSEQALSEQSQILRKTLVYQSFDALTSEYREAHMLQAVRRLWDFYRETGAKDIVSAYIKIMEDENSSVNSAPQEERIKLQAGTLHHQRRTVSQFYSRIATFINEDILPVDIFYSSWGETDLQIIPKILIPLENGIRRETIGDTLPDLDENSSLMQLYLKSKSFSNLA